MKPTVKPKRAPATRRRLPSGVVDHTPTRPPLDWELAVRRYREGWSISEIARLAGYALASVQNGLRKRGVELRVRRSAGEAVWRLGYVWRGVLARARGRTPKGRPISLCRAWRRFAGFRDFALAAGYRPRLALVRLDPERGFQPGNVRFVPRSEVARHTRWSRTYTPRKLVRAFGETKGFMEWARDRRCRVSASVLSTRLRGGMRPEAAISTPPSPGQRHLVPHPERSRARVRPQVDVAQATRMYERGLNFTQIGRVLGLSRTGVRGALRRSGVEFRPRSDLTTTREGVLLSKLWSSLRARCNTPSDHLYPYHGAKGIRVGREWSRFVDFRRWALRSGWKPGLCLMRVDGRKGYNPRNCRFMTRHESSRTSARPTRTRSPYVFVTAFGETKGLTAWARDSRCKVSETTFAYRLRDGMHPEDALTTETTRSRNPVGRRMLTAFGETKSLARWLRDSRCKVRSLGLRNRLAQGMDPEAAITTPPWATSARRGSGTRGAGPVAHGRSRRP